MAWKAPSHCLHQCCSIVNWTLRNKLQWNLSQYSYIFIQENAFENVIWKMAAILSRPQCVKIVRWVHFRLSEDGHLDELTKVFRCLSDWKLKLFEQQPLQANYKEHIKGPRYCPFVRGIDNEKMTMKKTLLPSNINLTYRRIRKYKYREQLHTWEKLLHGKGG